MLAQTWIERIAYIDDLSAMLYFDISASRIQTATPTFKFNESFSIWAMTIDNNVLTGT